MTNDKPILLFDGVCNLCNGIVQFIIKRDIGKKFMFAALQSESGKALLEKFALSASQISSVVFIKNGKCYLKSTAALKVLQELGGAWSILYIFIIIPRPVRDLLYDFIANRRYKIFGKEENCTIPAPNLKERFLE